MAQSERTFIPAAGVDWLLPFYDLFGRLLGMSEVQRELIDGAALRSGQRVLDIGCGTGTLVVAIKRSHPDVDVVGLDPDPKALARARSKGVRAGLEVAFEEGFADRLPYADGSFDRVFSSFMFHHLPPDVKRQTLVEAARVLKPGGSLHLLDFGGAGPRPGGLVAHLIHASDDLRDNFEGRIPELMREAGFARVDALGERRRWIGAMASYRAVVG